jgi:hypothetical protein
VPRPCTYNSGSIVRFTLKATQKYQWTAKLLSVRDQGRTEIGEATS